MSVLLAVFIHARYGKIRIRVLDKEDAGRYVGHGWTLTGFETRYFDQFRKPKEEDSGA